MEQTNLFLKYLKFEKRYSEHTQIAYQRDLDQFFTYIKNTYDLSLVKEVKHIHVRSWIVSLIQEKLTTKSINRKLSCLKTFFKFCLKRGTLSFNPMAKIISPKSGKRLPVFVDQKSMEQLFNDIDFPDNFVGLRDKTMLELLYLTGIRRAELIGLKNKT